MTSGRIVLVDQDCSQGHIAFNRILIDQLSREYTVHPFTTHDYAVQLGQVPSMELPNSALRRNPPGKRIRGLPTLSRSLHDAASSPTAAILFAGFDPITFPLLSRLVADTAPLLALVHNHLQRVHTRARAKYFALTDKRVTFLTLGKFVGSNLSREFGLDAQHVPHPYYVRGRSSPPDPRPRRATTVFAPSRSNEPRFLQSAIKRLEAVDRLDCRSPQPISDPRVHVSDTFEAFHERLASADVVLWAASPKNRVSGVVFEALAAGTPVVIPRGPFASELRAGFPTAVHFLEDLESFRCVPAMSPADHARFCQAHSPGAFGDALRDAVRRSREPVTGS